MKHTSENLRTFLDHITSKPNLAAAKFVQSASTRPPSFYGCVAQRPVIRRS